MTTTTPAKTYQVEGKIIKETERAVFICVMQVDTKKLNPADYKNDWFPKSQLIDYVFPEFPNDPAKFVVKDWILREKGYI